MPVARVQLEDGRIARFEVPEGTTPEQVEALAASQIQEPPAPQGALTMPQIQQMAQAGQLSPAVAELAAAEIGKGSQIGFVDGEIRRIEGEGQRFRPMPGVGGHFVTGAGAGLRTIGRAAGLLDPATAEADIKQIESLSDDFFAASIGEVVGEAAPFLPLAAIGPAAGVTSFVGRLLTGAGLGALEGAAITKGKGGDIFETAEGAVIGGGIAATAEAVLPSFGKMVSRVFRKLGRKPKGPLITPDGNPTPELQKALDETGTDFQFLTDEAVESVRQAVPGTDPAQAARRARFEAQDIPATRGDITQEFAQQAEEQRLISMATGEKGEPLRQRVLEKSEAFIAGVNDLVDELGVPERTGNSVKAALTGRKKLLTSEKNALYKEVAEAAPEVANVPIFTDGIEAVLPDQKTLRRLRRLSPNTVDAVDDLLVEFGINKNPDAVAKFADAGGEITPLNLGNSEEFRQALGQIDRADTTGATKVITGPLRNALDEEAAFIDDAIRESGITDEGIISALKEARGRVRTLKTEFSPQAITGRLIGVKRDGVTPIIEASKVGPELLRRNAPIENLRRTLQSLNEAGPAGKEAIQDIQASVVMNALEAALKAPSRKTSGIETIGGNQFAKALSDFGDDKLELLFRGNKKALNSLLNMKQTALDITPTAGAVPRGSAPVILDLFKRAGRLPGVAAVVDVAQFMATAGGDDRAVAAAIRAKPDIAEKISKLRQSFPTIISVLGIPAAIEATENE